MAPGVWPPPAYEGSVAKSSLCPSEALGVSPYSGQKPPTLRGRAAAVLGWEELPRPPPSLPTGDAGFLGGRELPSLQAGEATWWEEHPRGLWRPGRRDVSRPSSNVRFGTSRLPSAHTKAVRVLGDGVVTTLAHTDCVTTLDPWASSHSVPPVQAVGGDEAAGSFFPAPGAPRERAPGW